MDDLGSLLVLAFVLWSVLGSVLGRGRTQGPPRRGAPPRPRPRPEGARPRGATPGSRHETTQARGTAPGGTDEEIAASSSAADMIPDELWEILTGEKRRPAPVPVPEPEALPGPAGASAPREPAGEPEYEVEDVRAIEVEAAPVPAREARPVMQPAGRAESLEVEPVIVSLEAPPPPAAQRHAAFHARLLASEASRARRRAGTGIRLRLDDASELRRLMVLREVLGPPKALE